ncbi:MAG: serine/threonine protein kinase [Pseudanabaenaceae cyanobacterium]
MQRMAELLDTDNRYQLLQPLGGRVYLALDLWRGDRVAVKLLHRCPQDNPDFTYEMALYAAIANDYIAAIQDYGTTKTGHYFYAMEYVEGQTLAKLAATLSPDRALTLIKQVCLALQTAHRGVNLPHWGNAIVVLPHQKLHPEHIIVTADDRVKVLNFGFIREGEREESQTLVTAVEGEWHYVAPEQVEKQESTPRSDVYVLGLILYEILSGTNPYNVEVQNGLPWRMAHTTTAPVPLRQRSGCHHFPPELEEVVGRCLAKSPRERYPEAGELWQALQVIGSLQRQENDQDTQVLDPHSLITAKPDASATVSLSPGAGAGDMFTPGKDDAPTVYAPRGDNPTAWFDPQDAATVVDSFTTPNTYSNYRTFWETTPKRQNFLPVLLTITAATVLGVSIFAGIIIWQRQRPSQPSPPPEPIDRSI